MATEALRVSALSGHAIIARLSRLATLGAMETQVLQAAAESGIRLPAHSEILREDEPIPSAMIFLSGWACRLRHLADGRRQILSFLLPGDLIGVCRQRRAIATTTVATLTDAVVCNAPSPPQGGGGLAEAFAVSGALEEVYLFRQITRLGRLSAEERIVDFLFEIHERLSAVDLVTGNSFPLPITQEQLADTLGLTSVHVNRTLQVLRREGLIELRGGRATLLDRAQLKLMIDHRPGRVSHA